MTRTASWENCRTAKLLAVPVPSRQFIWKIRLQVKNHRAGWLGVQIDTCTRTGWALSGMFVLCHMSFITFRIFITLWTYACVVLHGFLRSAEMTLLLLINVFWIYTKRRSGFTKQTCQRFRLCAWGQICTDLQGSCLRQGYATVVHSCGLIRTRNNTSFLREVRRGFSIYLQKMLNRAFLSAVPCCVTKWSTSACASVGFLGSRSAGVGLRRVTSRSCCSATWKSVIKIPAWD